MSVTSKNNIVFVYFFRLVIKLRNAGDHLYHTGRVNPTIFSIRGALVTVSTFHVNILNLAGAYPVTYDFSLRLMLMYLALITGQLLVIVAIILSSTSP